MRTVAVVLAGGTGQRFGSGKPKQLHLLAGRPLLEHSVAAFQAAPGIDAILLVLAPGFAQLARSQFGTARYSKVVDVIEGGSARADSTRCAIAALGAGDCNVLLHDAARPLVDQRIIAGCVTALQTCLAVGVVVPSPDTIVVVSDGVMTEMPSRESLRRCQTPQGFRLSVLRAAHELALADPANAAATDDCGVVLRYRPDVAIRVVPGSERNIKITYPADLDVAEALLSGGRPERQDPAWS
jgi:2-C-methyl-D-erythritol 4-phosphate cytidylyltransferase